MTNQVVTNLTGALIKRRLYKLQIIYDEKTENNMKIM